jgi:non-heme chloroperoxidase
VPLLFVHGAYVGAWCWAEHFLPHFAAAGFDAYALSLRGHGESPGRAGLAWHSVADYVDDVVEAIAAIGTRPVLIGHSMGAFVVQKYLERHAAPGAVLLAPVPPQGLGGPSFELAMREPALLSELNGLIQMGRASPQALARAMFAQPIDADRLARYQRLTQRESQRAIWDMTLFNPVQPWRVRRVPTLYLAGDQDRLIPHHYQRVGASLLGLDAESAAGFGHGLMLETGWLRIAERVSGWLHGNASRLQVSA